MKIFCLASGGAASDLGELHCGGCRSALGVEEWVKKKKNTPHQSSVPKIKPTCGVSYWHAERPQLFAVVPLLSASVQRSRSNLAALRKGNPCVAYGCHLLPWLGDSGHGRKVPGSWHGQAAKPALGKRWQPCYKLILVLHKVLCGWASAGPTSGCVTSPKFPGTVLLARPRPIGRRFRSVEPGREHRSWTLIKVIRRKGKMKEETGRRLVVPGVGSSTRREHNCNSPWLSSTYYATGVMKPLFCQVTALLHHQKGVKGKRVKGTTAKQNWLCLTWRLLQSLVEEPEHWLQPHPCICPCCKGTNKSSELRKFSAAKTLGLQEDDEAGLYLKHKKCVVLPHFLTATSSALLHIHF